jgi:uncharacterized protein (UPF0332 family)
LAVNWRDFLPLATQLAAGATEAEWRSAVSRAYYTIFHVARRLLSDLHFTVPRADRAHQYLVFRLSNCGDAGVEQAGRDLDTLRRLRNRADYDDVPALGQAQAAAAVQLASLVVASLDAGLREPVRSNMMQAMIAYERDVLRDVTWQP